MKSKLPLALKPTNRPKTKQVSSVQKLFRHRDRGTYARREKTQ